MPVALHHEQAGRDELVKALLEGMILKHEAKRWVLHRVGDTDCFLTSEVFLEDLDRGNKRDAPSHYF
jgi:hypothetical protein